jgi:hypothetical protein
MSLFTDNQNSTYLALADPSKFTVHIDQTGEKTPPAFNGDVDGFVKHITEQKQLDQISVEKLKLQTKNKVKKCPNCGKPNAFTLNKCNQCGRDLSTVPISYTNNVFTGFIYGIAKGPFPFFISLRKQTEKILVFDDLLALTPCHLNCIPTDVYIPDLRTLFGNPIRGRELLLQMKNETWDVACEQYLSNKEWYSKLFKNSESLSVDELASHVCAGLNYPPSQYQLHLQFMIPPFTPFHWNMYQKGAHFTPRRFFPIEYMLAALDAMIAAGNDNNNENNGTIVNASSMNIEEIVTIIKEQYGVDYDSIFSSCYVRYGASHTKLSNWDLKDFGAVVVNGTNVVLNESTESGTNGSMSGEQKDGNSVEAVNAQDKNTLQNYGRPYDEQSGRPTGTYYKFAKSPPLPEFT